MGKKHSFTPLLFIYWEGKNKGIGTETTPLGIKSMQTHDRCLVCVKKRGEMPLSHRSMTTTIGLTIARQRKSGVVRSSS